MRKLLFAASVALGSSAVVLACTAGSGLVDGGLFDGGSDGRGDEKTIDGDIVFIDAGGGDGSTSGHIDPGPFPTTCSQGLAGLTPAGAFDAIQIRVTLEANADAGSGAPYTIQETRGTPCATAVNGAACNASFQSALVGTSSWSTNAGYSGGAAPPPPRYAFYVVTKGDTVTAIASPADLATFLAPVDTVTEAIDLHHGPLGGTSTCPRIRTDADGYSFLEEGCASFSGSGSTLKETVVKISRSGSESIVQTAGPFPDPAGECIPKP
jgi:hypothetical protein